MAYDSRVLALSTELFFSHNFFPKPILRAISVQEGKHPTISLQREKQANYRVPEDFEKLIIFQAINCMQNCP